MSSRCQSFTHPEVIAILKLVEKYKKYIINTSTCSRANLAKDAAWRLVAREFNNLGFEYERMPKVLRTKFENLKRLKNKGQLNLLESESEVAQRLESLQATNIHIDEIDTPRISKNEMDPNESQNEGNAIKPNDEASGSDSDYCYDEKMSRVRSQNFSQEECRILLQCVKPEKVLVFDKDASNKTIQLKKEAWLRITKEYNKQSPRKRSTQVLKTKFCLMKKMARKLNSKDLTFELNRQPNKKTNKHDDDDIFVDEDIKTEPAHDDNIEEDSNQFSEQGEPELIESLAGNLTEAAPYPDPLSSVLNGDSGIGSSSSQMGSWDWNQTENKEVVKLKLELLNYQMETAKLERKRIEDALLEEARERESRATERALRLRAARLDAVRAGGRLPPSHPALHFPADEARAVQCLQLHPKT